MARRIGWIAARAAVGLGLVALLLARVDPGALLQQLAAVSGAALLGALLAKWLGLLVAAWRWQWLQRARGIHVRFRENLRLVAGADLLSLFLPGSIGGDVYRAYGVRGEAASLLQSAGLVAIERYCGLLGTCLLAVLGVAVGGLARETPALAVLLLALLAGLLGLLVLGGHLPLADRLAGRASRLGLARLGDLVRRSARGLHGFRAHPGLLLQLVLLSIPLKIGVALQYGVLAWGISVPVDPVALLVFLPLHMIASSLPISLAGLGVREANTVLFFSFVGMGREDATALAFLMLVWLYVSTLPQAVALLLGPDRPVRT